MTINMEEVVIRKDTGAHSALVGMTYPELVALSKRMREQDSRVVFDSLRPICDELWNFIDDQRSIAEICESVCMEFDFRFEPSLLAPLLEGMANKGLVEISG